MQEQTNQKHNKKGVEIYDLILEIFDLMQKFTYYPGLF